MGKKLTNNLGLKIIAILIAFVGWLVIINVDDPVITKTVSGIIVTLENEQSILDAGKCYEIKSGDSVTVVVKGKKSVVDMIDETDFNAVADLSKYSITNAVPVEISTKKDYGSNMEIIEGKTNSMMIILEDYITKQFSLKPKIKGEVAKGYYITEKDISASPNRIEVSGPKSVVSKIETVKYIVDVTDASESFSTVCEPTAYNSAGKAIDSDKIKFGSNRISASGTPLYLKSIKVNAVESGEVADGYVVTGASCSLKKIKLASSDKSVLDSIQAISVPVNVSGATGDITNEVDISNYVSGNVRIVTEDTKATVTINVEQMMVKEITFDANSIKFSNIMNDIIYDYDSTKNLSVTIRGREDIIKDITIESLVPTIDLGLLRLGRQDVMVSFENLEGVEITDNPTLTVRLEKKKEETPVADTSNQVNDNQEQTDKEQYDKKSNQTVNDSNSNNNDNNNNNNNDNNNDN